MCGRTMLLSSTLAKRTCTQENGEGEEKVKRSKNKKDKGKGRRNKREEGRTGDSHRQKRQRSVHMMRTFTYLIAIHTYKYICGSLW